MTELVGSDVHGFRTWRELNIERIMEEAGSRWLRLKEIHAMLCNYKCLTVNVEPMHLPPSGTIVLFDQKMLRHFRRDGHNWKKKKNGKTGEAHEVLKVGNEVRIHAYYAHGQDNPKFFRRCYCIRDESLGHIVLVHYREIGELPSQHLSASQPQSTITFENDLVDDLSSCCIHRPPSEFPYGLKASLLRELDCSRTNIKFLPESLPACVALEKLILKRCQLFMELPPQVGELPNLEMLDLDETEILSLPQEIGRLSKLKFLRVSFYGYKNCGKKLRENAIIHPGTISTLSQLADLSINVNPDDERWYAIVEDVIEEACSLQTLRSLTLYVPNAEIFGKRKAGSTSLICYPLHKFRFTIGQHKQRIISRVPKKIEAQFQKWERSLKFIKGRDIPGEIKSVLKCATAFYLDRHAIATSLSDFGIEDLQMLEFCLLEECNQIETIIDGSGEESSKLPLEPFSLQYLHIYHLKSLVTIWRNPSPDLRLFSGLKFLALHKCPKLSVILSVSSFANLNQLEVLIVEDCPQVTCIVSPTCDATFSSIGLCLLPNLKTILLLYLPNLTTISSGFQIAPQLKSMGVYNCPKLESIYIDVISSKCLEVIKGEKKWWEALKWGNSEWETKKVDYLHSIFSPIQRERDVMSQMEEIIDT